MRSGLRLVDVPVRVRVLAALCMLSGTPAAAQDGVGVLLGGGNSTTSDLSKDDVRSRKVVYGAVIATAVGLLTLFALAIFMKRSRKEYEKRKVELQKSEEQGGTRVKAKDGVGVAYAPLPAEDEESKAGMGALSSEELREMAEEHEELAKQGLTKAQIEAKMAMWAQKNAAALREEHATYLRLRWYFIVCLLCLYASAAVGLPLLHVNEVSCEHGFFWETHMQFLAVFMVNKLVEIWLCDSDPTLEWAFTLADFCLKFLPSFIGFFDGYSDANAVIIAAKCEDSIAHTLAILMGVVYFFGVVVLQWMVLPILANRDPSQACLFKLIHMDLLALCITLPPEHKWIWNLIACVRTVGEDIPQAILQSIYLIYVVRNPFMLVSVLVAIGSSLKALHDARARHLAAAGSQADFEAREKDFMMFSCSQDGHIRCWNTRTGDCTNVIAIGNPANQIAAVHGLLYSSHDDGKIREWDMDGSSRREFDHKGTNGTIFATPTRLYTWSLDRSVTVVKEWSLESGHELQQIGACVTLVAQLFVKFPLLYTNAPEAEASIAEFNLETAQLVRTFEGHTGTVNALFATKRRLFSGSHDGTAKEWSLASGLCSRTFGDHCSSQFGTVLLVAGELLYNGSDNTPEINEWSLTSGQKERTFAGHSDAITGLVTLNDHLFSASMDQTIREWSLDSGRCLRTFEGHTDMINRLVIMQKED